MHDNVVEVGEVTPRFLPLFFTFCREKCSSTRLVPQLATFWFLRNAVFFRGSKLSVVKRNVHLMSGVSFFDDPSILDIFSANLFPYLSPVS